MFPFPRPAMQQCPFPVMRRCKICHKKEARRKKKGWGKKKNDKRAKPPPKCLSRFPFEPSRGMQNRLETSTSIKHCREAEKYIGRWKWQRETMGDFGLIVSNSRGCLHPRLPGKRRARSPCAQPRDCLGPAMFQRLPSSDSSAIASGTVQAPPPKEIS
ncbi:hypothetical protein LZ32DRAFT_227360 [Colletotrichum eremochloae]|nr:hypothetical protein LZ32DRAFT_227360 [Colletotrichum eremochloae]